MVTNRETITIWNEHRHDVPLVVSMPHSGTFVPQQMREQLLDGVVLPNTDWYLPELYAFLQEMGVTVLINLINRYVVDPNRDTAMQSGNSYRTSTVYLYTTQQQRMYAYAPDEKEVCRRIQQYYYPYHAALCQLLAEKRKHFPRVYLLDLHSFGLPYGADLIFGDGNGGTCSPEFLSAVETGFAENGFQVGENIPFSGGYITKHYGKRGTGVEALQIELWYRAYIADRVFGNEELPERNLTLFQGTQKKLETIFCKLQSQLYCSRENGI